MEQILNVTVFVLMVWWSGIWRGTDTECYCVFCEGLGEGKERRTDTEYYCVCCEGLVE